MNNLNLIQYWHQGAAPVSLKPCQDTWRTAHSNITLRHFDQRSAAAFIAEHFGTREQKAFSACALPAMASDYFRYCALSVLGGLYVDMSWENHRPLPQLLEGLNPDHDGFLLNFNDKPENVASDPMLAMIGAMKFDLVLNGIIYTKRPQTPFIQAVLELSTSLIERRAANDVGLVTGIGTLIPLINLHKLPQNTLTLLHGTVEKQFPQYATVFAAFSETLTAHYDSWRVAGTTMQQIPMDDIAPYIVRNKSVSVPERQEWRTHKGSIFT